MANCGIINYGLIRCNLGEKLLSLKLNLAGQLRSNKQERTHLFSPHTDLFLEAVCKEL